MVSINKSPESRTAELKQRIATIKDEIGDCTLIAVSKYTTVDDIRFAYQAGHRDFGESRVQDLKNKSELLHELDIDWHFIGRLQTNKINALLKVSGLKYIHSIDSIHLLEALIKRVDLFEGKHLGIFLQFNTSGEAEKGGFGCLDDLLAAEKLLSQCEKLSLAGLMTIGRIRTQDFEADAKKSFEMMVQVREEFSSDLKLSMGMSRDYQLALEFGSDFIRVGSAIFG